MTTHKRPSWDQYFMGIASAVSSRSHDPDTQHGAVIADADHRPLGFGFNGLPRGGDESIYPLTRPDKYRFMVHAETNAILNCSRRPDGATLYVTGLPCIHCMVMIVQAGITRVVYGILESRCIDKEEEADVFKVAKNHGVEMVEVV